VIDGHAEVVHDQRQLLGSAWLSQVRGDDSSRNAVDTRQIGGQRLELFARATGEHQVAAAVRELPRELFAEPGRSTGN
jgi:hypothetical protein